MSEPLVTSTVHSSVCVCVCRPPTNDEVQDGDEQWVEDFWGGGYQVVPPDPQLEVPHQAASPGVEYRH